MGEKHRFPVNRVRQKQLFAAARRLRVEREQAAREVDTILREATVEGFPELANRAELRNCGALERLEAVISRELTRKPDYAEAVARLAITIAETLVDDVYPAIMLAQSRAHAWKNLGKALSYLARYSEATDAFSRAEEHVNAFATLAHDLAVVHLNMAINYTDMGRHNDALQYLAGCKSVFLGHGDDNLFVLTSFYEGVVLQRLDHYREAREAYLLLLAAANGIQKPTLAALHQAIGVCSIELRDFEAAEHNLAKAITLHRELGQTLDAVKGEYGRGRLLLRRGSPREAIVHLLPVRHQFLKHSLTEEAGLCGLEIVEGMLALGESERAERLARTIMNEFLAASLNSRAITTLGFLAEAIAGASASPKTASNVREYVISLRTNPEREFKAV